MATPDGNPMARTRVKEVTRCSTLVSRGKVKTMTHINRPVSKKVMLSLIPSSYDTSLTNYLNCHFWFIALHFCMELRHMKPHICIIASGWQFWSLKVSLLPKGALLKRGILCCFCNRGGKIHYRSRAIESWNRYPFIKSRTALEFEAIKNVTQTKRPSWLQMCYI